jgi:lipopolysaccharide transport system ATP-binding protein
MSEIAIRVEALSKQYRIGRRESYGTLRDTLAARVRSIASGTHLKTEVPSGLFWALKDVYLEIERGVVLGVIGRNGAGKSTLLKILSRITEPTEGHIEIHGRVGSLLEVGTGFHPELTGRENVFLNGAILGMAKADIARRFDEIVAFAEVDRFIDTPVKHYSSGMYTRLAFAVAANLDTDILLVDEVLAVGDVAFQKKCIGKMADVVRGGRTILLVSHSLPAIESLCSMCVVLDNGRLQFQGSSSQAIERYLAREISGTGQQCLLRHPGRLPTSKPTMQRVTLLDESGRTSGSIRMGTTLSVSVAFTNGEPFTPVLGLVVRTNTGTAVFGTNGRIVSTDECQPVSHGVITAHFDRLRLMPGSYVIDLFFGDSYGDFDIVEGATSFEVLPTDVFGTGKLAPRSAGATYCPATFAISDFG